MTEPTNLPTARSMLAKIQALQRAGVTHLPKPQPVAAVSPVVIEPIADRAPTSAPATDQPPRRPSPGEAASRQSSLLNAAAGSDAIPAADRPCALTAVAQQVAQCTRCGELAATRTQTVFGVGDPAARLAFLGEAPGADEDRQGEPFVGRAGQLLTDIIEKGLKLRRRDVYIFNILKCRPPGNRTPLPEEAANCREYLDRQLAIIRPEFLVCLGACAAQNLLDTTDSISRMRGKFYDYAGIRVLCTYHPAYLLRNPASKQQVWDDMKLLMREMGLPLPG
jgi:DNA polymerase